MTLVMVGLACANAPVGGPHTRIAAHAMAAATAPAPAPALTTVRDLTMTSCARFITATCASSYEACTCTIDSEEERPNHKPLPTSRFGILAAFLHIGWSDHRGRSRPMALNFSL